MAESPTWKKPSDVMRRRSRKSIGVSISNESDSNKLEHTNVQLPNKSSNATKRKNPFSSHCETKKHSSIGSPPNEVFALFDQLEKHAGHQDAQVSISEATCSDQLNDIISCQNEIRTPKFQSNQHGVEDEQKKEYKVFPHDWSLKTRARFVSTKQFNWCWPLRSLEESRGIGAFVSGTSVNNLKVTENADIDLKKLEFQSHLMLWMHPNIPWLQLFPRIYTSKGGQAVMSGLGEEAISALHAEWSESMIACYQNVKNGSCSYMYICCYHMTIMFRSAGICRKQVHAVITPTTRGFREALKQEGIQYDLPLCQKENSSKTVSLERDESQDDRHDESSAANWLEDLGLDKKRYRSLEPAKIRDQTDDFRQIDYRPESTLLVEGGDTQALLNYLLNCPSLVATTGLQAGLPPTILAPVAFKGASLQSLKVMKHGEIFHPDGANHQQAFIDVTGPILPHSFVGLSHLFNKTQDEYMATFNIHEPTLAFNCIPSNIQGSSVHPTTAACQQQTILFDESSEQELHHLVGKTAIRELVCRKGLYNWTLY